jgi:hypothetical protein
VATYSEYDRVPTEITRKVARRIRIRPSTYIGANQILSGQNQMRAVSPLPRDEGGPRRTVRLRWVTFPALSVWTVSVPFLFSNRRGLCILSTPTETERSLQKRTFRWSQEKAREAGIRILMLGPDGPAKLPFSTNFGRRLAGLLRPGGIRRPLSARASI